MKEGNQLELPLVFQNLSGRMKELLYIHNCMGMHWSLVFCWKSIKDLKHDSAKLFGIPNKFSTIHFTIKYNFIYMEFDN